MHFDHLFWQRMLELVYRGPDDVVQAQKGESAIVGRAGGVRGGHLF